MQTFFATLFLLPLCFGWVLPPPSLHSTRLSGSILPKDFKNGLTIEIDGQPSKIVEFSHSKQARGAASTNARFKNLITGATLTKTIRAAESFDPAPIDKVQAQVRRRERAGDKSSDWGQERQATNDWPRTRSSPLSLLSNTSSAHVPRGRELLLHGHGEL